MKPRRTRRAAICFLSVERRWYGPAIQKSGTRAGVTSLLSFLAARNVPQVVISDYEAEYKLESLGLDGRFASIYVGENVGFVKPSPKVFPAGRGGLRDFQRQAFCTLVIEPIAMRQEPWLRDVSVLSWAEIFRALILSGSALAQ